jgi:hypothetical protein
MAASVEGNGESGTAEQDCRIATRARANVRGLRPTLRDLGVVVGTKRAISREKAATTPRSRERWG